MADIRIHHCTLRVVRRGGWSWGPNPRALLESATTILPQLLAEKLAGMFPDSEELVITHPVRLVIKIKLDDLLKGGQRLHECLSRQSEAWRSAIGDTTPRAATSKADTGTAPVFSQHEPPFKRTSTGFTPPRVSFLRLLVNWSERGMLERMLAALSAPALALWHEHLYAQLPHTGNDKPDTILSLARDIAAKHNQVPGNVATWLRLRIAVAVVFVARHGNQLSGSLLRHVLDQLFPEGDLPDRLVRGKALQVSEHAPDPLGDQKAMVTQERPVRRVSALDVFEARTKLEPVATGEVQICTVLPFLMLGVLSRLGYIDVLSATLAASGLEHDANHFAIALAHKVLPAPDRGWHREPAARRAAAVFSGVREPLPEPALAAFGRHIADALSPLDRFIALALADGHNPNQPLLLHRLDKPRDSWMLFDVEGCFPVIWHEDVSLVLDTIREFGPVTVLVTEDAATPLILRKLSEEHVRFVTAAPPGRWENWRVLHAPSRYWTNDHESAETKLIRMAHILPQATQLMEAFIDALVTERPAVVPRDAPALERSVTLAAGAALGTMAWTLWGSKEPTDPALALERFADLEGRVSFDSDSVRIRVPLGRRHQDLREHGYLADIAGVPWFGGRVVEFPGI